MELKFLKVNYGKSTVEIPYYELVGNDNGKMGFISAGLHGNEINGINIVRNFIRVAKTTQLERKIHGILLIFPVLNPSGFKRGQRLVPQDNKDLNIQFGKSRNDSMSKAIASELSNLFKKSDFGIDFHDLDTEYSSFPFVRISKSDRKISSEINVARKFGTKMIYEKVGNKNRMDITLNTEFITPTLTVETSNSKIDMKEMMNGIRNILTHFEMLHQKHKVPATQYLIKKDYGIAAEKTGIINLKIKLGDKVHEGDRIGTIYLADQGREEVLFSKMCGIIFSKKTSSFVRKGEQLYSVLEYKNCHTKRTTLENFEILK